jgi:hypothetical protein
VNIYQVSARRERTILDAMEERTSSTERSIMIEYRHPTPDEIAAHERAARRLRAETVAKLAVSAAAALKALAARGIASLAVHGHGAGPSARRSL